MERNKVLLLDIARAAQLIVDFISGMTQQEFLTDIKTQSAVLYQLLVIGEAVKRLSREFRTQHSHIPWALIAGMRDHLIHGYDIVDWQEMWKTAAEDVPHLLKNLQDLLPSKSEPREAQENGL